MTLYNVILWLVKKGDKMNYRQLICKSKGHIMFKKASIFRNKIAIVCQECGHIAIYKIKENSLCY
jgi:RNase P subunit RPR2